MYCSLYLECQLNREINSSVFVYFQWPHSCVDYEVRTACYWTLLSPELWRRVEWHKFMKMLQKRTVSAFGVPSPKFSKRKKFPGRPTGSELFTTNDSVTSRPTLITAYTRDETHPESYRHINISTGRSVHGRNRYQATSFMQRKITVAWN